MESRLFQDVLDARAKYLPEEQAFFAAAVSPFSAAKQIMLERVRQTQADYIWAVSLLIDHQTEESTWEATDWQAMHKLARNTTLGLALLAKIGRAHV